MKKTTENKPNIRLLPEETIELLKQTLEEPPVSRMEEELYCAYLCDDLKRIRPGQIVDQRGISEREMFGILKRKDKGTVYTPCVFMMNGSLYIAQIEKSGRKCLLRLLKSVPLFS